MSKKRQSVAALMVVAAALAGAMPANADPQPGCQAYGQFVAGAAQAPGPGGLEIVSPIATSAPGALAAFASSLRQATCP